MNFWDKITGNDMKRELREMKARVAQLPTDYQVAWRDIQAVAWLHSDFSGRALMPVLWSMVETLEDAAASGSTVADVFGGNVKGFAEDWLADRPIAGDVRSKWRRALNLSVASKLTGLSEEPNWQMPSADSSVSADETSADKILKSKKVWRAHVARAKALPKRYYVVYHELEKYCFKLYPANTAEILAEIVDLFAESAARGQDVLEFTGTDVAIFADGLIDGPTSLDAADKKSGKIVAGKIEKAL